DLQLAAELGKTLLERNKELEIVIRDYKVKGDEQEREILHLRKHINAMTEVNDSRLKVYEQLEVGIQDLERANQRLNLEKNRDKKQMKALASNTEVLEARCEELNQLLTETQQSLNTLRRNNERLQRERIGEKRSPDKLVCDQIPQPISNDQEIGFPKLGDKSLANSTGLEDISIHNTNMALSLCEKVAVKGEESDGLVKLLSEMELLKRDFVAEQQRCAELEEQLVSIIQENQELQNRFLQTSANEEMMSVHEEFSLLDDVRLVLITIKHIFKEYFNGKWVSYRQGQMCSRCLRDVDECMTNMDEQSSVAQTEDIYEDDERSSIVGLENPMAVTDHTGKTSNSAAESSNKRLRKPEDLNLNPIDNPYRDLIEKYEALLEVQRTSFTANNNFSDGKKITELSKPSPENKKDDTMILSREQGRTSTEFSEAETSSSGFSEETSNKHTQTDERPSFFLCSISNGKDCKFSIYDDVSPIECHFRNRPEYKELFKEIFGVLKKAAESNEGPDKIPSLDDDAHLPPLAAKVPPVTPTKEESPNDFMDDTQSIVSSIVSEQSIAISECVTKLERKTAKMHIFDSRKQQKKSASTSFNSPNQLAVGKGNIKPIEENGHVLTPLKREPLEYLTVGVGIKKKNRRKHRHQCAPGVGLDLIQSPEFMPKNRHLRNVNGERLPNEVLNKDQSGRRPWAPPSSSSNNWNGSPMVIYNRNMNNAPRTSRGRVIELNGVEFYHNTVSQDLHKLKKLDLSYAEVLRRADASDHIHSKLHSQRLQKNGDAIRKYNQNRQ
ncbi:hypothetical protein KR009_007991, partial [Drosophila setifemur]